MLNTRATLATAFALAIATLSIGCSDSGEPAPNVETADVQGTAFDDGTSTAQPDAETEAVEDEAAEPEAEVANESEAAEDASPSAEASLDEMLDVEESEVEAERRAAEELVENEVEAAGIEAADQDPEARSKVAASALEQMHELGGEPLETPEVDGYISLTFPQIGGFEFHDNPPERADPAKGRRGELTEPDFSQLPDDIRKLNNQKVAISGYMIPNNFRDGGTSEFTLVPVVPSCFFCVTPAPMDWIEVTTADGEYVPYAGDQPVTVTGTFSAGAIYSGVFLHSLYRLSADEVLEFEEN
ncbi:MAG: DUF3299 domain-containing protein [Phycisphaeraceae bacterium]